MNVLLELYLRIDYIIVKKNALTNFSEHWSSVKSVSDENPTFGMHYEVVNGQINHEFHTSSS